MNCWVGDVEEKMTGKEMKKRNSLLEFSLLYLILYIFLGYIFTNTVFANNTMVYISFMFLLGVFFLHVVQTKKSLKVDIYTALWLPYLIYTMLGYLMRSDVEHFAYWAICIFLLIIAKEQNIAKRTNYNLIFRLGLFFLIGIFVQIFLPNFYNERIATLFTNSYQILYWGRAYGFAGFSYQLDTTAVPIIYAIGIYLFYLFDNSKNNRSAIKVVTISLLIIGVLLTGKRMLAIIAILVPIIVIVLSRKVIGKGLMFGLIASIILGVGIMYIYQNAELFLNSNILRRIAKTFIDMRLGVDVSTGRSELYSIAFDAYRNNPFLGIGVGRFTTLQGAYTATHNAYFQVLCEQGLFGLLLFLIPLSMCLIRTITLIRTAENSESLRYLKLSLYIQLVFIFYSFSGNTTINLFGYIMYFLSITLLIQATSINN